MAAQALFSHREMHGKNTSVLQDMMHARGVNWNDYPATFKRGTLTQRVTQVVDVKYRDRRTGEERVASGVERSEWRSEGAPVFTQAWDVVEKLIGVHG